MSQQSSKAAHKSIRTVVLTVKFLCGAALNIHRLEFLLCRRGKNDENFGRWNIFINNEGDGKDEPYDSS